MKKIILSMLMLAAVGTAMAQTPEEKAAAKAAAAAQKAAKKEAKAQVVQGMKLRDEISALYNVIQEEEAKGDKAKQEVISTNQANIKLKALEANKLLMIAFGSGNIHPKQLFDAGKALDDVSAHLLNPELTKASQHETFDTLTFAKAIEGVCRGCYTTIEKGNPKDELQKPTIVANKLKMPKLLTYYAYLCIFYTETKNLDGAEAALAKYVSFAKDYPLVANEPEVKNPQYPAEQFAFNIYLTAFNAKRYDLCEKYYQLAFNYDNPESHNYVVSSRPQIYLNQGDTAQWVNSLKEMIKADPTSTNASVATQNLMAYYSQKGNEQLTAFADEMVAANPNNKVAQYGKGYSFFAQEKYEEAAVYFEKAVELDSEYYDAVYMTGMSNYRLAVSNNFKYIDGKKYKTQAEMNQAEETYVKQFFRKAQPYFERAREMKPEKSDDWASPLTTIYKNTNQVDKAKELEQYL